MPALVQRFSALVALLAAGAFSTLAQTGPPSPVAAEALVKRALAVEVREADNPGQQKMAYRLRKQSPRLTTTKEIVETREGDVARLVAVFDKPLSVEDEQKEEARLRELAADPDRQEHRRQREERDMAMVMRILRMLPEAFVYSYAGPGVGPGGPVARYSFKPNPAFRPPDFETQALTSMTGELWIDLKRERASRLEGHLQADTDYGWGVLGKLDKGGWVTIEQGDVGSGAWRITRFQMKMNLRILFKSKEMDTAEEMSGYAPIPQGIDYRQAIGRLLGSAAQASAPSTRP